MALANTTTATVLFTLLLLVSVPQRATAYKYDKDVWSSTGSSGSSGWGGSSGSKDASDEKSNLMFVKAGGDFAGTHKIIALDNGYAELIKGKPDSYDASTSGSLGLEYLVPLGAFAFGAGAEYQLTRYITQDINTTILTKSGFSFLPVYGVGRLNFGSFYLAAKLGFGIFSGDNAYTNSDAYKLGMGAYYGGGLGLIITSDEKPLLGIEAVYTMNTGGIETGGFGGFIQNTRICDIKYSKLSVSLGYYFAY